MSPRWLVGVFCLLLIVPVPVTPQVAVIVRILKISLCTVCSGVFILARCAPRERLLCRVIAFKLKLLCNTFPCTNYGAPSQRKCARLPFGCLPWNIRIRGLCEPLKLCCNKGGFNAHNDGDYNIKNGLETSLRSKLSNLMHGNSSAAFPAPSNDISNYIPDAGQMYQEGPPSANITDVYIPTSPQEYMKDWPANEDDLKIVEQTIKQQFDKFMLELHAVNKQETELGREAVRIPSFEEFRSVALGETTL